MRSQITAHLPEDLEAIYDAAIRRRGEIARGRLARGVETPEPRAVAVEAERLDAIRDTLRNPESTVDEIAWVRTQGGPLVQPAAEADTTVAPPGGWAAVPAPTAEV